MNTPDKTQPKKHFFKVPANFDKSSQEEQKAFYDQIIATLDEQKQEDEEEEGEWVRLNLQKCLRD